MYSITMSHRNKYKGWLLEPRSTWKMKSQSMQMWSAFRLLVDKLDCERVQCTIKLSK